MATYSAQSTDPVLAFVIPAHNEEKLIGKCLAAVVREVARTGVNAEIVVVDNASTDRTHEIASSFPGVTVVNEPMKGIVHARSCGFDASTAPLVANLDADTVLAPGWIERVLSEFNKDPTLVALSGPSVYYDLPLLQRFLVKLFYGMAFPIYLFNHHVLRIGAMLQGGNFVLLRSAWSRAGGYDRSIAFYGEDTDIARRISKVGTVKWTFGLPMPTSGRRLAKEGVLTTGVKYALNYLWVTYTGRPLTREYKDIRPA